MLLVMSSEFTSCQSAVANDISIQVQFVVRGTVNTACSKIAMVLSRAVVTSETFAQSMSVAQLAAAA